MSRQKTLLNFFSKVSKRQISNVEDSTNGNLNKKTKLDVSFEKIKNNENTKDDLLITPTKNELKEDEKKKNEQRQKDKENSSEQQKISQDSDAKSVNKPKSQMDEQIFIKIRAMANKYPALQANIGESWFRALAAEFTKAYFIKLSEFLQEERKKHTIYPPIHQVWSWTRVCKISEVRVVILGQDPYHNPGQAHGLCFSVPKGVPSPPSLINMYKELEEDIEGFKRPNHGNLMGWARQGVLLLNACLTVRAHEANSHKDKGWEQLTDAVIQTISTRNTGVVFLLWGAYAQKKAINVDKKKHHLLKAPHPSPLSASRGFFGCKHFSMCNDLLKKDGKQPINWSDLPLE